MAGKYMSKIIDGRETNIDVNHTNGVVHVHKDVIGHFVPADFDRESLEVNTDGDYAIPLEQFLELSTRAGWDVE